MRRLASWLIAGSWPLAAACSEAREHDAAPKLLSIDDVYSIATPTSTQLSPDGRLIAFTLVRLSDERVARGAARDRRRWLRKPRNRWFRRHPTVDA